MKAVKNIRLKHFDYSRDGYYFVTICTNYNRPYLAKLGEKITKSIQHLNEIDGLKVDYFVVMPTHIHLILILSESKLSLGEIVRRFKAAGSREAGIRLWQPNYYEHVIRSEKALLKIREYIQNNPLKEKINFETIYEA
ncbi:MAG: transposase [Candidatus Zixiibacteriota bacterium]